MQQYTLVHTKANLVHPVSLSRGVMKDSSGIMYIKIELKAGDKLGESFPVHSKCG